MVFLGYKGSQKKCFAKYDLALLNKVLLGVISADVNDAFYEGKEGGRREGGKVNTANFRVFCFKSAIMVLSAWVGRVRYPDQHTHTT